MRMSKYARLHAPLVDAQEEQGTTKSPEPAAPADVPYRRALKELGLPPDIEDPPPLEVLETLVDLKRRGMLTPELMEEVAEEARKHGLRVLHSE
jgi:hypothetical protein